MHEHVTPKQHNLTHKFHKILKKTQKFSKTPKPRSKMHEKWKMKVLRHVPSDLILVEAENGVGREIWVREKCLGQEKRLSVEREVRKWNMILYSALKYKSQLYGSKYLSRFVEH